MPACAFEACLRTLRLACEQRKCRPAQLVLHQVPEFMPTGTPPSIRINAFASGSRQDLLLRHMDAAQEGQPEGEDGTHRALDDMLGPVFPGTDVRLEEVTQFRVRACKSRAQEIAHLFNTGPITEGMFLIVPAQEDSVPFSLGRCLRSIYEDEAPYVVFGVWKVKQTSRGPNIFGKWIEQRVREAPKRTRVGKEKFSSTELTGFVADCLVCEVLVWPINPTMVREHTSIVEKRSKGHALIPFEVFDFLHLLHGLDCTHHSIGSERGSQYVEHFRAASSKQGHDRAWMVIWIVH